MKSHSLIIVIALETLIIKSLGKKWTVNQSKKAVFYNHSQANLLVIYHSILLPYLFRVNIKIALVGQAY